MNLNIENASFYKEFNRKLKLNKNFTLSGLTSFTRLLLLNKLKKISDKKVLFITSTEQTALKYKNDYARLFDVECEILPYYNTSPYEMLLGNLYDYQKQIEVLNSNSDIIFAPVKVLVEKFPSKNFFDNNSFIIKKGDEILQKNILQKLINLGYKRSTMVSDIGEFSIRGDIVDIYSINEYPVRIEFWGDEVVDIRFFNNETQKSINKIDKIAIKPLYKFITQKTPPKDFPQELIEQLENEVYFEGINAYQSYFNDELVNILDYYKEYIIVFDEYAELSSKLLQIEESLENNYNELLKNKLIYSLKSLNHFTFNEIQEKLANYQKIYFSNFISEVNTDIIDVEAQNIQIFDADMLKIVEYLNNHKDFQIIIATDFQERVKEILKEFDIFNVIYIKNIKLS